jgi:AcrR family transcriptional regulator
MARPRTISDESLLDAARSVFLEKGYQAPVSEIARRAGVSSATVFLRFETKEHLFVAVIVRATMQSLTPLLPALLEEPDPRVGLRSLGLALLSLYRTFAPVLVMGFGAGVDLLGRCPIEMFGEAHASDPLVELLNAHRAAGRLRPIDTLFAARAFSGLLRDFAILEGLGMGHVHQETPEAWLDGVIDIYLTGIEAR